MIEPHSTRTRPDRPGAPEPWHFAPAASRARPVAMPPRADPALSRIFTLLWCAMLWLLLTTPLASQTAGPAFQSRQGFWWSAGLGQGYTDLACGICGGDRETGGLSGYARAGGTMSTRLLVGGELALWRRSQSGLGETLWLLSVAGYWYPRPEHGWYTKLGLGLARYRASEEDEEHLVSQNFAVGVGTGYEMRVNPRFSVVPFAHLTATPSGNLNREITRDGGYSASRVANDARLLVIQVGIGVTRH